MSFIIDLDKDGHRQFAKRLNDKDIKCRMVWKDVRRYCFEPTSYEDYSMAKKLQITMQEQGVEDVPIV